MSTAKRVGEEEGMACHGSVLGEAHAVCLDQGMASVSSRPRHEEITWPVCTSRKGEVLWHRETRAGDCKAQRSEHVWGNGPGNQHRNHSGTGVL